MLFGSPMFATETGAKVDVSILNADCKAFNVTGGALSFSGTLGANPDLIKVNIPANFGTWRAFDGSGASFGLSCDDTLTFFGEEAIMPCALEPDILDCTVHRRDFHASVRCYPAQRPAQCSDDKWARVKDTRMFYNCE